MFSWCWWRIIWRRRLRLLRLLLRLCLILRCLLRCGFSHWQVSARGAASLANDHLSRSALEPRGETFICLLEISRKLFALLIPLCVVGDIKNTRLCLKGDFNCLCSFLGTSYPPDIFWRE